ncbi:hypothetical protein X975_03773, partial [Stegodyphus mimosarum]
LIPGKETEISEEFIAEDSLSEDSTSSFTPVAEQFQDHVENSQPEPTETTRGTVAPGPDPRQLL